MTKQMIGKTRSEMDEKMGRYANYNTYVKMKEEDFYLIGVEDTKSGITLEITVPGSTDQEEVDAVEKNFMLRTLFDVAVAVRHYRRYGK